MSSCNKFLKFIQGYSDDYINKGKNVETKITKDWLGDPFILSPGKSVSDYQRDDLRSREECYISSIGLREDLLSTKSLFADNSKYTKANTDSNASSTIIFSSFSVSEKETKSEKDCKDSYLDLIINRILESSSAEKEVTLDILKRVDSKTSNSVDCLANNKSTTNSTKECELEWISSLSNNDAIKKKKQKILEAIRIENEPSSVSKLVEQAEKNNNQKRFESNHFPINVASISSDTARYELKDFKDLKEFILESQNSPLEKLVRQEELQLKKLAKDKEDFKRIEKLLENVSQAENSIVLYLENALNSFVCNQNIEKIKKEQIDDSKFDTLSLFLLHYNAFYRVIKNSKAKLFKFKDQVTKEFEHQIEKELLIDLLMKHKVKELFDFLNNLKCFHINLCLLGVHLDKTMKEFRMSFYVRQPQEIISVKNIFQIIFLAEIFYDEFVLNLIKYIRIIPNYKDQKSELLNYFKSEMDNVLNQSHNDYLAMETYLITMLPLGFPFTPNGVNKKIEGICLADKEKSELIIEKEMNGMANGLNVADENQKIQKKKCKKRKRQEAKNKIDEITDEDSFEVNHICRQGINIPSDASEINDDIRRCSTLLTEEFCTKLMINGGDKKQLGSNTGTEGTPLPNLLKSHSHQNKQRSVQQKENCDPHLISYGGTNMISNNNRQPNLITEADNSSNNKNFSNIDELVEYITAGQSPQKSKKKGNANLNPKLQAEKSKAKKPQTINGSLSKLISQPTKPQLHKAEELKNHFSRIEDDKEVEDFIQRLKAGSVHFENTMKVYPFSTLG